MPKLYVLVGVPGSGKSYYIEHELLKKHPDAVIASTDNYIDNYAKDKQTTYNEEFKSYYDTAVGMMKSDVKRAVVENYDIIWDQTNISVKSRTYKIKAVPDTYEKIAVMFMTPDDKEHARRLANRPGKNIPDDVIANMKAQLEIPTAEEGFDDIIFVDNK